MKRPAVINRRQFLVSIGGLSASVLPGMFLPRQVMAAGRISKPIPKTGEQLPVIGMGTSRTFDYGHDQEMQQQLLQVMQSFFDLGGGMIDSSPMYGDAQHVIGKLLPKVTGSKKLFAATKVWIEGKEEGIEQMEASRKLWGIQRFDLMQIHNLVDWETHLDTLKQMKAEKAIRYIGITTSHGRFHYELKRILQQHDFDFLQLTYNVGNHDAEPLLDIARERGIAVIVNRPFQRGDLFHQVKGQPLPAWTKDFGCDSWGQYFLKYAVSHPAVTCAIPATTKVKHMKDNMGAGNGRLPSAKERERMRKYFEAL